MRRVSLFCLVAFLVSGSVFVAYPQGRGRGNAATTQPRDNGTNVDVGVDIVFTVGELRVIREWFGNSQNLQGLPPGLAKRETLPPGLQRQLQRNGTLPPGLQARLHPVPVDLHRRLPDLREGTRRVIIGGSIVLVDDRTSLILDVAAIF
jgi:hypothetical protein